MSRALLITLALVACVKKKKPADEWRELAVDYRAQVCSCKDPACIAKVNQDFASRAATKELSEKAKPNPETIAILSAANECVAKIQPPEPTKAAHEQPAVPAKPGDADALVRSVRDWQRERHPRIVAREIVVYYVDSSALIDPEHGGVHVHHGAPDKPFDDPKRRTGAPIGPDPTKPDSCPSVYWGTERKWNVSGQACYDAPAYVVRCTPSMIWKRALEKGAPADALATLRFAHAVKPEWTFTIIDEPRAVNISHTFEDDCELAVEKP